MMFKYLTRTKLCDALWVYFLCADRIDQLPYSEITFFLQRLSSSTWSNSRKKQICKIKFVFFSDSFPICICDTLKICSVPEISICTSLPLTFSQQRHSYLAFTTQESLLRHWEAARHCATVDSQDLDDRKSPVGSLALSVNTLAGTSPFFWHFTKVLRQLPKSGRWPFSMKQPLSKSAQNAVLVLEAGLGLEVTFEGLWGVFTASYFGPWLVGLQSSQDSANTLITLEKLIERMHSFLICLWCHGNNLMRHFSMIRNSWKSSKM